jgi:SAM-dependent MidA family methyltransferase
MPHPASGSATMLTALRQAADASGMLSYRTFIQIALYHPDCGYYRVARPRVGRGPGTDFYTSATLRPVFAALVAEAAARLCPTPPESTVFVEIGAEPGAALLDGIAHRFAAVQVYRLGHELTIPPTAVVFSNELLDAQPFHRLRFTGGAWRERGVRIAGDRLEQCLLAHAACPVAGLPDIAPEGYELDWPSGALELVEHLAAQSWHGLWLACDYGLDHATLCRERPAGTARTYQAHRMGYDLLENPGQRDITCHICWDAVEAILRRTRFTNIRLQRQEAFFMNHSPDTIARLAGAVGGAPAGGRRSLMELLHPQHLGARFQVLSATRNG